MAEFLKGNIRDLLDFSFLAQCYCSSIRSSIRLPLGILQKITWRPRPLNESVYALQGHQITSQAVIEL